MVSAMPAVPTLNFSKLPVPIRVHYPTPKDAAPQAHPGGKHLMHRSWPMPPAPPPKVMPKRDAIMCKELTENPKVAATQADRQKGAAVPSWWGSTMCRALEPARHIRPQGLSIKPIGSDLLQATLPPRSVVFWGSKSKEVRGKERREAVVGIEDGKVRSVDPKVKKDTWKPSKDETAQYFHVSKNTYIRGSAALVKQQTLNDRAQGMTRPSSAASERPRDRRSSSPALVRPVSACSMRSGCRKSVTQTWWTKNSWEKCAEVGNNAGKDSLKQRILDDIMQETKFVRIDDSDAYKFAPGGDNYKWTEVEVIKTKSQDKKLVIKQTKTVKAKAKKTSLAERPGRTLRTKKKSHSHLIVPDRKRATHNSRADQRDELGISEGTRSVSPPRPSDITTHKERRRLRDEHASTQQRRLIPVSDVRAVMHRASSTLRHLQALRNRHMTEEELQCMLSHYPEHISKYLGSSHYSSLAGEYSWQEHKTDSSQLEPLSPDVVSPSSLDEDLDEEDEDEQISDTFDFTEDEAFPGSNSRHHYDHDRTLSLDDNNSSNMTCSSNMTSSSVFNKANRAFEKAMALAEEAQGTVVGVGVSPRPRPFEGGGREPEAVTPKDAYHFMPSTRPASYANERSFQASQSAFNGANRAFEKAIALAEADQGAVAGVGMSQQQSYQQKSRHGGYLGYYTEETLESGTTEMSGYDEYMSRDSDRAGVAINLSTSSISSAESLERRSTEEDSREPWGPPSGAADNEEREKARRPGRPMSANVPKHHSNVLHMTRPQSAPVIRVEVTSSIRPVSTSSRRTLSRPLSASSCAGDDGFIKEEDDDGSDTEHAFSPHEQHVDARPTGTRGTVIGGGREHASAARTPVSNSRWGREASHVDPMSTSAHASTLLSQGSMLLSQGSDGATLLSQGSTLLSQGPDGATLQSQVADGVYRGSSEKHASQLSGEQARTGYSNFNSRTRSRGGYKEGAWPAAAASLFKSI